MAYLYEVKGDKKIMLAKKEKFTRLQLSSNDSLVSRKEFIFSLISICN